MIAIRHVCLISLETALFASILLGQGPVRQNAASGHQYFVDCASSRNGSGESPESPWNSLDGPQSKVFSPGDVIQLKRGTQCNGSLSLQGSGSAQHPIRLTSYGEGPRPKIIAGSKPTQALRLFNQEYWDVDSLDLSGGNTYGIFVSGDKGVLHHIHLSNLLVHDVFGTEMKHKEWGLVTISPGAEKQWFEDVLVDGVTAWNTNQWVGILVGGGNFGFPPEEVWSQHVIIRNSIVHDVQGDGIVLFRVRNGLIDSTVAWRTGMQQTQSIGTPNAIWTWMCHDCIVSNSEAFLTDSPGVDGGAFDIDYGNTNNSVLDSFGHDTLGYCIAVFGAGFVTRNSVVRGNVCIDNGRSPRLSAYQGAIFLYTWNDGSINNVVVENNTVYWNPLGPDPALLNDADLHGGPAVFRHNVIYSTSPAVIRSNAALSLDSNQYFYYGTQPQRWRYGKSDFDSFSKYQQGTGQDAGSSFEVSNATADDAWLRTAAPSPTVETPGLSDSATDFEGKAVSLKAASGQWRIVCSLPVKLTADELLDSSVMRQLVVLKSVAIQFPVDTLKIIVRLYSDSEAAKMTGQVRAAVRDLQMNNVIFLIEPDLPGAKKEPQVVLISPDGKVRAAWDHFAGPTAIGFAVRRELGMPIYPQMEAAKDE